MSRDAKLAVWGGLCAYTGVAFGDGHWVAGIVFAAASIAVRVWAGDDSATAALRGKG